MKNTSKLLLLSILLSSVLFAQNTVEDLESEPVVEDLAPSVIDMPSIEDEMEDEVVSSSENSYVMGQTKSKQKNKSNLEIINGVMQKKVKESEDSTVMKIDEEAPEVEGLEPASLINL